jgi:hypothetical protein
MDPLDDGLFELVFEIELVEEPDGSTVYVDIEVYVIIGVYVAIGLFDTDIVLVILFEGLFVKDLDVIELIE